MKLSDRVVAGVKPVGGHYALASEAGFDDGKSPVSAFECDGALPHLLVDLESNFRQGAVSGSTPQSASNFLSLLSKSTPSVNVGGW